MDPILKSISTKREVDIVEAPIAISNISQSPNPRSVIINSPEDALEALKAEPHIEDLVHILGWLDAGTTRARHFNVKIPSPWATKFVFVLVHETIPHFWQASSAEGKYRLKVRALLRKCLKSVVGIGAVVARLRLLAQTPGSRGQKKESHVITDLLQLVESLLEGNDFISSIWSDISVFLENSSQRSLQWKELISTIASGKLLSVCSEASKHMGGVDIESKNVMWVSDGIRYATWLGRNIQYANELQHNSEDGKPISQVLSKALGLGYAGQIIGAVFSRLMAGDEDGLDKARDLVNYLPPHEKRTVLYALIRCLSLQRLFFDSDRLGKEIALHTKNLKGVSALIAALVDSDLALQDALDAWLIGVSAPSVGYNHTTHRAIIAAVSCNKENVVKAMHKGLSIFAEKLYIKHTPILHQEVTTQILLMLCGRIFREDKKEIVDMSRSSIYLNAVSNRLAASSQRARFLGMVFGTAISELVDPEDKRMKFGADELNCTDGNWYRSLTSVTDPIGSVADLKSNVETPGKSIANIKSVDSKKKMAKPTPAAGVTSKIVSIEELENSSDSDDEDLPMYEKPDDDPSDEDEDPTLVERDKPTAPVYVRDLIAGLRDTENFELNKLALSHAANLIRRKASFGSEVSENIEELATLLVGLSDKWDMEEFQQMRLRSMIAVLTAEPLKMGQWLSRTFYNGDYSMGQRASVLTTLSLGAREIAGLGKEDAALTGTDPSEKTFPSKKLPDKLHRTYLLEAAPTDALSSQLEKSMIQPMAASAADQITGPQALKVRTFSSRMAVERKRTKPIPNALAKIVAEGFFFPLTGLWRIHLQTYGENSSHTSPFLLSHFLKTLSLILHASGSSTLSLPQMNSEFWDLLLSLRARATDPSILDALLFAFLTLLDINQDSQQRLAEEHAKELLETQGWVEHVFETVGGGSEEGDRIRMLAAGVLMRTREVVEKYQRSLMGDMLDYVS